MRMLLVMGATVLLPSLLGAQQSWTRQVQERVGRATDAVPRAPGVPVRSNTGVLNMDESAIFPATLRRGTRYAIIAVCDDDCVRLELTLLKPSGSEIAKERNSESMPTIHFTSDTTMDYSVRIKMERCRWNPCWYAVAIVPLGKNPP